jgi:hypothetical protein
MCGVAENLNRGDDDEDEHESAGLETGIDENLSCALIEEENEKYQMTKRKKKERLIEW